MNDGKSSQSAKKPNVMIQAAENVEQVKDARNDRVLNKSSASCADIQSLLNNASIVANTTVLPVLPAVALPGWLGEVVKAACENSEVHPVFVLADSLSQFGAQISGPYTIYDGVHHSCCTNMVIVGRSSKSWKATRSNVVDNIFEGIPNRAQHIEGHMLTGESLIDAVSDEILPIGNKNRNQAVIARSPFDKRLLFREKEICSALANARRFGSPLTATISGFFEKGSAEHYVKSVKITATEAHVSIIAHTRCSDYSVLLNDVKHSNDFASYYMWLLVDRVKVVPRPKSLPEDDVQLFREIIISRIVAANRLTEVKMSKQATKLWGDLYPCLTKGVSGVAGSVLSRLEIHTIRLALLYALAAGNIMITTADLIAAHSFVQYAWESVTIIFKGNEYCENDKGKILCALHAAPNHELSRTQISNEVFDRNTASEDIVSAWRELEKLELVEVIEGESKTGRKKTIIRLVSK